MNTKRCLNCGRLVGKFEEHVCKKHTLEARIKMSNARKGKSTYWLKGKHLSEEHKAKIRNANKLRVYKEEWKVKIRENHPLKHGYKPIMLGKHHTKETKEKIRQGLIGNKNNKGHKWTVNQMTIMKERMKGNKYGCGQKISEEHKEKLRILRTGILNPAWNGGTSFEPYGLEFNNSLREKIRKRDNYRCKECFRHQDELRTKSNKPYKLNVHHIDFNKKNNKPENLISLCLTCHNQTQFNREHWIIYYQNKVKGF